MNAITVGVYGRTVTLGSVWYNVKAKVCYRLVFIGKETLCARSLDADRFWEGPVADFLLSFTEVL